MSVPKRSTIRELLTRPADGREVWVQGWTRSVRKGRKFSFMVVNDGTCQPSVQVIVDANLENYANLSGLLSGACVGVHGRWVESQGQGQSAEIVASKVVVYGLSDSQYPLQKKALELEFLRQKAHLRARTNLFGAIFRIRHCMAMSTHRFFDSRGFYYLNTPVLTTVDGEGAGELFQVTSLDLEKATRGSKALDYQDDYFGRSAHLCVTGQLEAECLALGLNAVYTFGPTFRAENSNTPRHLAEFWMVEPEMAFVDLEGNADLAEDYIKFLIRSTLDQCPQELQALGQYHQRVAKERGSPYSDRAAELEKVERSNFERLDYGRAIEALRSSGQKFEYAPEWGAELQTEHERYLTDTYCSAPVVVTDYPKDCKAFYMKQNSDGKTVRAMDVLVPGVGELVGGSQREDDLEKLKARISEVGIAGETLWWYLELRQFGSAPHSGFGLGFERAIRYVTGMNNIRDVIPFPRTPRNCDF